MKHGSLFSGIGGFDLAATWMKWSNVFQCERDPFCQRVLRHYWPQTTLYEDVKTFDGTQYQGQIELLSGGFPCQPFSAAGQRKGTADDRYLWPHMLRIVREIRPRWVVGENVFGLVNWEGGLVFRKVLTNLEVEGYDVWPYVLPAAAVGAPHRRDRIFFVACRRDAFSGILPLPETEEYSRDHSTEKGGLATTSPGGTIADSDSHQRSKRGVYPAEPEKTKRYPGPCGPWDPRNPWQDFPSQSPLCGGNDGLPTELDRIAFSSWRKESLKAYGNAIVPQVAWNIFQGIQQVEFYRIKAGPGM